MNGLNCMKSLAFEGMSLSIWFHEVAVNCIQKVTENHGVGGSIPPLGTTHFLDRRFNKLDP